MTAVAARAAARLLVAGVVQGVGFRPYVHRLAAGFGLAGWVRNQAGDVAIHVEGEPGAVRAFCEALPRDLPPLARIERCDVVACPPAGLDGFTIAASRDAPDRRQPVAPDVALCAACEAELLDPTNRRFRYPFITCTDCGPRYTVIEAMPYDRERTSMRAFAQCPACLAEYRAPGERRYHSETNSCPACGPRLWLEGGHDGLPPGLPADPMAAAAHLIQDGRIVALRGLGGFHLAVDATNADAVVRLRERKHREAKPFAVMVRTVAEARVLAEVSPAEEALLRAPERPIVLLAARADTPLAAAVAPGLGTIGVMLAYTPLHHLLLAAVGRPLVMTSGNASDEPIAIGNADARRRLARIADALLLHDREIVARYDDSVLRVAGGRPVFLRRARGYAPLPVDLPLETPRPLVAVGPHLKNTFALAHGRRAYVSQHIGDLENLETLDHFRATLGAYRRLFRVAPEVVIRDLHPGYLSTRVAEELGLPVIAVQHHHAHVAAVLAEHGETGPAVGLAFDGTGYGDDGRVWGAEVLVADLATYHRVGRLRYAPLPGGDLAARTPWRVARGYLSLDPGAGAAFAATFRGVAEHELAVVDRQIARSLNAPLASSLGRLFDAAAAVLGTRTVARYEAQAAMELEALAAGYQGEILPFPIHGEPGDWVLEPVPLLAALGERRLAGHPVERLAAAFHDSVAAAAVELATRAAAWAELDTVALGGGVFQNARLLKAVEAGLRARKLRVLVPERLSPNDGAVSYGQAAVGAARLAAAVR